MDCVYFNSINVWNLWRMSNRNVWRGRHNMSILSLITMVTVHLYLLTIYDMKLPKGHTIHTCWACMIKYGLYIFYLYKVAESCDNLIILLNCMGVNVQYFYWISVKIILVKLMNFTKKIFSSFSNNLLFW